MIKKYRVFVYLFFILLIYALSLSFRIKHLNQPLGRHHEWITAHTLLTLKIWEMKSASSYYFSPVYSYDYPEDKKVGMLGGISDADGNDYYVSYGPFAFIFPYAVFKILQIPASAMALQILNMILHFVSAFLILLSIHLIFGRKLKDGVFLPALIGYSIYLFLPATLWFQGNVYFSDTLVQLFFISGIYFTLRLLYTDSIRMLDIVGIGASVFLGIYTEWLGLFFAFTAFIVFFLKGIRNKNYFKPAIVVGVCSLFAFLLIVYQYAQISGMDSFINYWIEKYTLRSGAYGIDKSQYGYSIGNAESYKYLEDHYNTNYLNLFNLFAFILPAFLVLVIFKRKYFFSYRDGMVLLLSALPVLMHHLILFNFTAVHDFSTLKSAVFFSFLVALISFQIIRFSSDYLKEKRFFLNTTLLVFIGVKCFHGYKKFESKNNPANYELNHYFFAAGIAMKEFGLPEEAIATDGLICPEMMYYSGRNPGFAANSSDAKNIAKWTNKSVLWVPFQKDNPVQIKLMRYFPNGDSTMIK